MTRHPIGFDKLRLPLPGGRAVRLHVWSGEHVDDPHDHRWSFWHLVLWGEFRDRRYAPVVGDWYATVTARPDRGSGRSYTDVGRGGLIEMATRTRRTLPGCYVPRDVVHSFTPVGRGPHITLLVHGKPTRDASTIWRTS